MSLFSENPDLRRIMEDKISDNLGRSSSVSPMDISLILCTVESVLDEHLKVKGASSLIKNLIERVSSDLHGYQNPGSYQESDWYDICRARAEYAEDVLGYLQSALETCDASEAATDVG